MRPSILPIARALVSILGTVLCVALPDSSLKAAPSLGVDDAPGKTLSCCEAKQIGSDLAGPPGEGPPVPDSTYDVTHYDISISVDFGAELITGAVAIDAVSLTDGLSQILVDFEDSMVVSSVTQDGDTLAFTRASNRMEITLTHPFDAGLPFSVRIEYAGHPVEGIRTFRFDAHNGTPIGSTMAQPWYARRWWPCKEDPADKATASMSLTVPTAMMGASNGVLNQVDENDSTRTFHWSSSYPISTYLVSAAVTNYVVINDAYVVEPGDTMPVAFYVYPEDSAQAQVNFGNVIAMIDTLKTFFGEYPFSQEKYGHVMYPQPAMEHQTLTSLPEQCVSGCEDLIVHELAHQWWGDLVTCATWHDVWLNEGFATWAEALWHGSVDPPDGYKDHMGTLNIESGFQGSVYRNNLTQVGKIFNIIVYNKGAWVIHMLRGVLGESDFWNGLSAYRSAYQFSAATTEDLRSVCESVSGKDLDWFFQEWVYGENRPEYDYYWEGDSPDPGKLTLRIRQVQTDAPAFVMPIEIEVVSETGTERFTVWDSIPDQTFVLDVTGAVQDVVFDPDDWILERHTRIISTALAEEEPPSGDLRLRYIMPHPFSSLAVIEYSLPASHADRPVDLAIYDVRGRLVRALVRGLRPAGTHTLTWDGLSDMGRPVASGVFFLRLRADGVTDVMRLVKLR